MSVSSNNDEGGGNGSKRIAFVERDLYLKPLLRLKQQETIIEKGLTSAIENLKLDSNLSQNIVHEYKETAMKRQKFLNSVYQNMEDVSREMETVINVTRHPEEIENLDINTYKLKLIKLSQKMQDLKKSCYVQSLKEEQVALEADLREFQPNLQKYQTVQQNATNATALCLNKSRNRREYQDYKELNDFHALVALTGHTGNWTMEEHLFFLKIRKKSENVPALVSAIQNKYPDLSVETIVNHESWYKQYEALREKQKIAVKEWRRRKEEDKRRRIEEGRNFQEFEDVSNEPDEEISTRVERKIKSCPVEMRRRNRSADSIDNEKKELIRKWRIEKESKRSMDEEQFRLQAKLKREAEESRRKKRREKIQEALEEYRRKKCTDGGLKEENEEGKEKGKYDASLIKAFRKQDEAYTKKRINQIERSRKPSKSEAIGIKRLELVDAKSYSTLLNSTKVWRERCKTANSPDHSNDYNYIKNVPRICIRWRNEESDDLNI